MGWRVPAGVMAFTLGCATSAMTRGPDDALLRVVGGGDFAFSVRGGRVVGPKVEVTVEQKSIHGVISGQLLRLESEDEKIFGGGPLGSVSLTYEYSDGGLRIRGLYGPFKIHLHISYTRIDGAVVRNWFFERSPDGVFRGGGSQFQASDKMMERLSDIRFATVFMMALASLAVEGQNAPGIPPAQLDPQTLPREP